MAVSLNPSELSFRRPFTKEVTQLLRLGNLSQEPVAFKVKTTAPRQYCVRPNSGRIEPGSEVEVQVLLQAMREDPPLDAKCKDKFLVQSVLVTPERDLGSVQAIWQNVEKIAKNAVEEKKIRVIYLPADRAGDTTSHAVSNGIQPHDEASTRQASVSPYDSPPAYLNSGHDSSSRKVRPGSMTESPLANSGTGPDNEQTVASAVTSKLAAGSAKISESIPTSSEELKAQLAQARQKIASLSSQIETQGLRRRKAEPAAEEVESSTSQSTEQQQTVDGVPVQIVAVLCLLSFLLAYFFF